MREAELLNEFMFTYVQILLEYLHYVFLNILGGCSILSIVCWDHHCKGKARLTVE